MRNNVLTRAVRGALYSGVTASALALAACGGSSGGGDGSGSLSLGITDAPVDNATSVTVTFNGLTLKPADGERIEIDFDTAKSIDLLKLQGETTELLLSDEEVPAGRYDWIELDVDADDDGDNTDSFITLETDPDSPRELVLPTRMNNNSGPGLRLVSGFDVPQGGSADFTIDFDLRKSVVAPNSGQVDYLLRPALRLIDNTAVGSISASVDNISSCPNGDQDGPAVYVFDEGQTPDDVNTSSDDVDPITTAQLEDDGNGTYVGTVGFLEASTYTVSFTCEAGNDVNNADDNLSFEGTKDVTVDENATAPYSHTVQ